jgi:hypothetical protein
MNVVAGPAFADCSALPDFSQLRSALIGAITPASGANGGLGFNMWGTLVANDGLRRRVLGEPGHLSMAGQPRYLRTKSEYGQ